MAIKNDPFSNANGAFHDNLLSQHGDTSYKPTSAASQYSGAAFSAASRQNSPPRRLLPEVDAASTYSGPPPSFTTVPRPNNSNNNGRSRFGPTTIAQTGSGGSSEPQSYNSSRGVFNAGGPFPIIKPATSVPSASAAPTTTGRPLPNPGTSFVPASRSRHPQQQRHHPMASGNPTLPDMSTGWHADDNNDDDAPYPVGSYDRQGSVLQGSHTFDPYDRRF